MITLPVSHMARPKEFDRDEVLHVALAVFHRQGYEATSMQDLVDEMGIGRGSMYETFGNKRALFEAALARYADMMASGILTRLDSADNPVNAIARHLREMTATTAAAPSTGCFLGNTCVELAPHDPDIANMCRRSMARLEKGFRCALQRAQDNGQLPPDKSPQKLARFLVGVIQGLAVLGKGNAPRATLRDMAEVSIAAMS